MDIHSEYQPMRASFSSWCDEYYNLKKVLIGELFRSKAILELRQAAVKTWGSSLLKVLYFTYSIIHFYKLNIKEKVINYILH